MHRNFRTPPTDGGGQFGRLPVRGRSLDAAVALGRTWRRCGGNRLLREEDSPRPGQKLLQLSLGSVQAKGGLRLDTRAGMQIGGQSGPAVVAGKPEKSKILSVLNYEGPEMPPAGQLPAETPRRLQGVDRHGALPIRAARSRRPKRKRSTLTRSARAGCIRLPRNLPSPR